eukprot:TRINITY_DN14436_c0_g1_i2.p2 TRINITY_DN14436_c0_g1~~TRINITY_DN14436_c0_g1_i2.p2  ORF type:complete len:214 (+),score=9.52 TRINITY_DN14436_c0_g1_i2:163-804(+)
MVSEPSSLGSSFNGETLSLFPLLHFHSSARWIETQQNQACKKIRRKILQISVTHEAAQEDGRWKQQQQLRQIQQKKNYFLALRCRPGVLHALVLLVRKIAGKYSGHGNEQMERRRSTRPGNALEQSPVRKPRTGRENLASASKDRAFRQEMAIQVDCGRPRTPRTDSACGTRAPRPRNPCLHFLSDGWNDSSRRICKFPLLFLESDSARKPQP